MGKMTSEEIAIILRDENPKARLVDLKVYADALAIYSHASANIQENGSIVAHPRTAAPIENPYLNIQIKASNILTKMRHVKCNAAMGALSS